MALTRKYNNGSTGWTDYDEKGNAVAAGTYNAPGTERNPFNADSSNKTGAGVNSGEGSLWNNATGQKSYGGSSSSGTTSSMKNAMDSQLNSITDLYNQQAADQAAKIRQAIETQTQQANNTKQDYTNQMNDAITTLNTERAKIPGQTTTLNNTASSQGMVNAQHIRNALSQMGLLQSGESASQQLLNDTTVQNNINANNLQGQELDMGYGNQIASAQTDLASKIKQINDAISLAQKQGDENALSVLQDAQAKIANAAATNAVDYNKYAYQAGRDAVSDRFTQQGLDAQAIQNAIDNVYRQNQADLAAKQWQDNFGLQQGELLGSYNGQSTLSALQLAADQAYKQAALAASSAKASAPKALTATQIKNNLEGSAYDEINNQLASGNSPENVISSITSQWGSLISQGLNPDAMIKYVQAHSGQVKPGEELSYTDANGISRTYKDLGTLGGYIPLDGSLEALRRLGGGGI